MKILFIGDVVGKRGQDALKTYLPLLKKEHRPQITIVNGENIADGRGITEKLYKWVLSLGVDMITLGNHAFDQRETLDFIGHANNLVRPENLPDKTPGKGVRYLKVNQVELAVVNLLGTIFMGPAQDPFQLMAQQIEVIRKRTPLILIDFHGEASSEKQAMAYLLDGKVSALIGTHTHVQTHDERILPKGTAYLTDVGMTGALNSIIGFKPEQVVNKFMTQLPQRLEPAQGEDILLSGVLITLNTSTGQAEKIELIRKTSQAENVTRKYRHV